MGWIKQFQIQKSSVHTALLFSSRLPDPLFTFMLSLMMLLVAGMMFTILLLYIVPDGKDFAAMDVIQRARNQSAMAKFFKLDLDF